MQLTARREAKSGGEDTTESEHQGDWAAGMKSRMDWTLETGLCIRRYTLCIVFLEAVMLPLADRSTVPPWTAENQFRLPLISLYFLARVVVLNPVPSPPPLGNGFLALHCTPFHPSLLYMITILCHSLRGRRPWACSLGTKYFK